MNSNYNTHILPNGLRIIHRHVSGQVVYCGFAIKAGTRDELPGEEGLAHFCEHASFKGTQRRKAWQVIQTLESVGGELNAYTNKESTVYYAAIQRQHVARAIDILDDMVFHSVYPDHEIEKEKEVVCDEIESYNDSPAELIFDDFENIIFNGHPLGHNILGTSEQVRRFTPTDVRRFTQKHYRPDNAIFFIYGDVDYKKVIKNLSSPPEEATTAYTPPSERQGEVKESRQTPPTGGWGSLLVRHLGTHQAHVVIGRRAYDINHPRRLALYLLNNILGGPAMSSRLNMSLRERNGLVYTVESSMTSYADTGLWCIYFGCDSHDVKRCQRLIRRELDRLMQKPLTPRQLTQAKNQLIGQIALACDSKEGFALDFAKSFLHYGWEKNVEALCDNIRLLTAEELQEAAKEIFAEDTLYTLIYQ